MKKLFLFALLVSAIGCSKNEEDSKTLELPEMVTVSFAMTGTSDVTVDETPLPISRAETQSTDLYGINIWYDEKKDGKINNIYGYGFFDNIDDMTVSLLTGYKYRFECALVKDGKNTLAKRTKYKSGRDDYADCDSCGYGLPFSYDIYYGNGGKYYRPVCVDNQFVLGKYNYMQGLSTGQIHSSNMSNLDSLFYDGNSIGYAPVDYYYGKTADYTPQQGGVVTIDMKHCIFGVKFIVTGVSDGTFSFSARGPGVGKDIDHTGIKSDTEFNEEFYTFQKVYDCWSQVIQGGEYSERFILHMIWIRGNGVLQELDPVTLTFKRNVLTTVNIHLNGSDTNNSFSMNIENKDITNETTDLNIGADDMKDSQVKPTE